MKKERIIEIIDDLMVECGNNLDNNNDYDTISYFGNKIKQEIRLEPSKVLESYIVVTIKEIGMTRVLFEEDYIEGNQFKTQNRIISVLKILGFEDFSVDLFNRELKGVK